MRVATKINNLVSFKKDSVYNDIINFLENKGLNSVNTRLAYERDIRQFFKVTRNKNIEFLVLGDLEFKHSEILGYKKWLANSNSASTVNRKMAALKSLFQFLERDYDVKSSVFDVDRIKERVNSYGILSLEECKKMMELVKKQHKGYEKGLLIEFAVKTSIRLEAILSLEWSNFRKDNGIWIVEVYDKGVKLDSKPISEEFYVRLLELRGKEKVFNLDRKTCQKMIRVLCKEMDIDRNVTFHSLKKTAINWVLDTSGDIVMATKQGNHSNINTTYKSYLEKNREFKKMPGIAMEEELDVEKLNSLSKEELLDLINECGYNVKVGILGKLKR